MVFILQRMSFNPESFDAVYAIEATYCSCIISKGVYSEIYKGPQTSGITQNSHSFPNPYIVPYTLHT